MGTNYKDRSSDLRELLNQLLSSDECGEVSLESDVDVDNEVDNILIKMNQTKVMMILYPAFFLLEEWRAEHTTEFDTDAEPRPTNNASSPIHFNLEEINLGLQNMNNRPRNIPYK